MNIHRAAARHLSALRRIHRAEAPSRPQLSRPAITAVILAGFAALIAPAAYLVGYDYYEGYMSAFGLQTERFPISNPAVYVFAFQAVGLFLMSVGESAGTLFNALLSPPLANIVISVLCLAVIGTYVAMKASQSALVARSACRWRDVRRRIAAWLKNSDIVKSALLVSLTFYLVVAVLVVTMLLALLWWVLPLSAYRIGQDDAKERLEAYHKYGCHPDKKSQWNNCTTVVGQDGKPVYEGLLITMNDDLVAIFQNDSSYVFKRKDEVVLRRKLHRNGYPPAR